MTRIGRLVLLTVAVAAAGFVAGPSPSFGDDPNYPTIDAQFSGTGPIGGNQTVDLVVTGRGGVPASGVGAVALNVAVTNPTAPSFLTAFPAGSARPNAANLNFEAGQTVPNMVIVQVGTGGQISLYNFNGTVDVVVDVLGWFPEGTSFTGLPPARLMDTREGYTTIDGRFANIGPVGSEGFTKDLTVIGRGGVPASGVGAVALNVAVANPSAESYLTVWPTGEPRPTAANLNYVQGQVIANMVMVKLGAGGQISLYNYDGTVDAIVDVLAWFPEASTFTGVTPARLMDTRDGNPTIDGQFQGFGAVPPDSITNLTVVGRGGIPAAGVGAVALNVTVTKPSASSYLTVWAAGTPRPTAANLNFTQSQTVPNMVIAKVGAGGQISLYNLAGTTDIVVDVLGWFPDDAAFTGLPPARLMDSRQTPPCPPGWTLTGRDASGAPLCATVGIPVTMPAVPSPDPRFSSCAQARASGYGPYQRGVDPEYDWYRDADGDGIVCE